MKEPVTIGERREKAEQPARGGKPVASEERSG